MEIIQEKLTKQGCIVIPIGIYGPESLNMRMDKIDLAEELFVINPEQKIHDNIWTDIYYANLAGKDISFLESFSYREIKEKTEEYLYQAEYLAQKQLEMLQHNANLDKRNIVSFQYNGHNVYDPWIREDMPEEPIPWNLTETHNPGQRTQDYYRKQTNACYIDEIWR